MGVITYACPSISVTQFSRRGPWQLVDDNPVILWLKAIEWQIDLDLMKIIALETT